MEITKEFFKEIRKGLFKVFISDVVIREINDAQEPKRSKLLNIIKKYDLKILPLEVVCDVNAINNKLNYKELDIRTPEEFIEND